MNQESSKRRVGVLFVCLGNICRSPTSEGVFRHIVEMESVDHEIFVDSAGTGNYHSGYPPDSRAIEAAAKRGVQIDHLKARVINHSDFEIYDYIIAMDRQNFSDLKHLAPAHAHSKIKMFMEFSELYKGHEVPDPYYGGDSGFERVLDMIEDASKGLLEHIKQSFD